jgi:hypothetical protein
MKLFTAIFSGAAAIFFTITASAQEQTAYQFHFGTGEPRPGWIHISPPDFYLT